jgi:ADP-ribose pyrophosphatase YjhB (NUDIX family)
MPTLGTNIAIIESGRILLIRHADFGAWGLPGGRVEATESLAVCAIREAREETGLDVRLKGLVGVYSLSSWHSGGNHTVLFTATPIGGDFDDRHGDEVHEVRYFSASALPASIIWWHQQRIQDALAGVGGACAWDQRPVWPEAPNPSLEELRLDRASGALRHARASWSVRRPDEAERLEVPGSPSQNGGNT